MKSFNFSMEKILELRQFEQKQAEAELGKANAEVARIQRQLDAIASQRVKVAGQIDSGEGNDLQFLYNSQNYFVYLDKKKECFLNEMAQAKIIQEQKMNAVREAMQKVKVLEKLKESKYRQWKKENQKEEELQTDDIVSGKSYKK